MSASAPPRRTARLGASLVLLALAGASAPVAAQARPLMTDDFATPNGPNGLITNQHALWGPDGVRSPVWEMTSGSLFSSGGVGWSGLPDGLVPDATSGTATGSLVFRLRTRRDDFGSVRQAVSARINGFAPAARDWDGVVLWPRYRTEFSLYFAYLLRRDGQVQLTKKCPGLLPGGEFYNGGTYFRLTGERSADGPAEPGRWYRLATEIRDNADGSVTITGYRDDAAVVRATDDGVGCPPIRGQAHLGVRGDNIDLNLDAYRVTKLPADR